jgi:hypothetical protein
MNRAAPAPRRVANLRSAGGGRWAGPGLRPGPRGICGQMKRRPLPPVCRPAGWAAVWRRLAMVGARQAGAGA